MKRQPDNTTPGMKVDRDEGHKSLVDLTTEVNIDTQSSDNITAEIIRESEGHSSHLSFVGYYENTPM